jgi:hypothetical protein
MEGLMMYHFRMVGIIKDCKTEELREVLYKDGKLSGDRTLVQKLKAQAKLFQFNGGTIAGYSPIEVEYIKDARAVILIMRELCHRGQIWGNHPYWR